eukprot:UN02559
MSHLELDLCEFCHGRGCESCYGTLLQASPSSPHHNIHNEYSNIPLSESLLTTTSVQSPTSLQEHSISPFPPQDINLNDGQQQEHVLLQQQEQQQQIQSLRSEITQRAASSRLNSRPIRPRPPVVDARQEQEDAGFAVLSMNVGDQIIEEQFEARSVHNTDDEGSDDLSHKPPNSMMRGEINDTNNNHSLNLQQKIYCTFPTHYNF